MDSRFGGIIATLVFTEQEMTPLNKSQTNRLLAYPADARLLLIN
jgi:hypothetical protein